MNYNLKEYPQPSLETFDPYLTIIDLLVNTTSELPSHLESKTDNWQKVIK